MATPDQNRIAADRARPRIMDLWWALQPLRSVVRFMNTGAHPDDETSAMLAALAFRDGINLSYACSTRGEGGQNDIGTEAGADLGALRTREMERAADILQMRLYWLSENPDDLITDFGFSKSGTETLAKWGRDRTLARFVDIVRTDRPDILCPTFLDVPGQHGHHRAMTAAAHLVMEAAADPDFPSTLPPWQVAKLYLPAWSGAGQSYDDDEPPPPATLTISGAGTDPISGWSWERIGQQSRAFHRTQGMGRWDPAALARDWPLHLARTTTATPDLALGSGLPATVADLAAYPGAERVARALTEAGARIEAALASFPDFRRIAGHAAAALTRIRAARQGQNGQPPTAIDHRLAAKEDQLARVMLLAKGISAHGSFAATLARPGDSIGMSLTLAPPDNSMRLDADLPDGWTRDDTGMALAPDTPLTDPYPTAYDPLHPPAPAILVTCTDTGARARLPFADAPIVLPGHSARLSPDATVLNRKAGLAPVRITLGGRHPADATATLDLPPGWQTATTPDGLTLTPPDAAAPGLYRLPLRLDGHPAWTARHIDHPHISPTASCRPAALRLLILDADLPAARIGYVGSGNDRVDHWLAAMGGDVTALTDADLGSDTALGRFDSIVVGIFAFRFRKGLAAALPRLHAWTRQGGTLVTLYHRPWDAWDPDTTPPRRIEIGQPSLRWRVTDETAPVRHLADHPALATPNAIGPDDWAGWVKERGLYFAKSWDAAYTPLIELADPGETPHRGALLAGEIGAGRHIHTSLILHHQMEQLVPGAFRLMANLIAPRA